MDIGSILKQARKNKGLLVKEVIHRLSEKGFKVSEKTLYGWENNYSQPSIEIFLALSEIYGIEKTSPDTEPPVSEEEKKEMAVKLYQWLIDTGKVKPGEDLTPQQLTGLLGILDILDALF